MFEFSNPDKKAAAQVKAVSIGEVAGRLRREASWSPYACVAMLSVDGCTNTHVYRVSQKVEDVVTASRRKLFGSESQPYRAMHVRRGDRCRHPESTSTQRCKSMREMPFLSWCAANPSAKYPRDHVPLYVATDEDDQQELQVLHDAGCLTGKSLPPSMFPSAGGDDDVDPVLAFLVEKELLVRAELSYTFGCSTTTTEVQTARQKKGLTPSRLYDDSGRFKTVPFGVNIETGYGAPMDCRAATLGE